MEHGVESGARWAGLASRGKSASTHSDENPLVTTPRLIKWPWSPSNPSPSQPLPSEPFPSDGSRSSPESGVTLLDPETTDDLREPGDHERYSHYVLKEKIVESAVTGTSVRALCGKKWIPGRDPMKFPICPICKEIHEGLRKRDEIGSAGGSGDGASGGSGA